MFEQLVKGQWRINTSIIPNIDATNSEEITKAELKGRKQTRKIFDFIKRKIPGFENSIYMESAAVLGVREIHHIEVEYTLTADDLKQCKMPDNTILVVSNAMDLHSNDGSGSF